METKKKTTNTSNQIKTESKSLYNSDSTPDDLTALGKDKVNNIRQDGGDDVQLTNRSASIDFAGKDLDVPGRKAASKTTTNRINDEENKLHSQGSASNEHLEEQSKQYTK